MTYREATEYLLSFVNYERQPPPYDTKTLDLLRFRDFLASLGNPQESFPSVLIAGTKGKGSTAAILSSSLKAQGHRVGLYTSPHLSSFAERIRINSQPIPEQAFADLIEELKPKLHPHGETNFRTVFEILTAMAFLYFQRQKADFAVLEVGLGGRLDSTNVVNPLVSVITSLSFDHTETLGNTLLKIAAEKAGIIKRGSLVANAPQRSSAQKVIERAVREHHGILFQVGREVRYERLPLVGNYERFHLEGSFGSLQGLRLPLFGEHQVVNAATAYAAVLGLRMQGIEVGDKAVRQGFAFVEWPGRFEVVSKRPYVVLDGAHNEESARRLVQTVKERFPGRRVIPVIGISSNKNIPGILKALTPLAEAIIVTRFDNPRAADPEAIANIVKSKGKPVSLTPNTREALDLAHSLAGKEDVILITGSLYLVGEMRDLLLKGPAHKD